MKKTVKLFLALFLLCLFFIPLQLMAEEKESTFSQAELDQMLAPVALYPDSLLSQILMASTYPSDVTKAVKWSKENPEQQGDAAVTAVQNKSWDPSVMSLVAFPQVLEMMGKQPEWVQNLGDAFLAEPDKVMDSAQNLRRKAKDAGNLETTKEQTVKVEQSGSQQTIIIEPANPQTVYVPVYNPTVVYGTWWWPAYTPYYYYPPGYHFGSAVVAGIGFGVGIAITNSLWGGCNWGHHDVDINVNRYNNINVNKKLDANKNSVSWNHNSKSRQGVPYRDQKSREKYNKPSKNAEKRKDYRGRDWENKNASRDAQRQRAQETLKKRGDDPAKARKELSGASGDKVRNQIKDIEHDRLSSIDRQSFRDKANSFDRSKTSNFSSNHNRSNALSGIQRPSHTSSHISRGNHSFGGFKGGGGFSRGGGGFRGRR